LQNVTLQVSVFMTLHDIMHRFGVLVLALRGNQLQRIFNRHTAAERWLSFCKLKAVVTTIVFFFKAQIESIKALTKQSTFDRL